jgi:hypothetical protein
MKQGLTIITIPSGYDPYVIVGWLRRAEGHDALEDEWEIIGGRVIRRFGRRQSLSAIARTGPADDTQLLDPSAVEWVHRLCIARAIPCDAEAWALHVPRPDGWTSA